MADPQVERTVDLDAPADDVWTALTDDEALSDWFEAEVTLDPVPGGAGRFEEPSGEVRRALVEEVEPGRRLSFRWWTDGDDEGPISSVTFELTELGDATRLVVTERALLVGAGRRAAAVPQALDRGIGRLEARALAGRHATASGRARVLVHA